MRQIIGIILIVLGILVGVKLAMSSSGQSDQQTSQERGPYGTTGYGKGKVVGRYSAPFVLLGIGLRLLMSGGSAGSISLSFPKRSGSSSSAGDPRFRGGQNTFASNPAKLDLNFFQWLAGQPAHIGLYIAFAFLGLILLTVKWIPGLAVLVAAGITFWRSRQDMRRKFFVGDVCPGVVISAQQGLVAVWTDLKAAANIPRPAIKILRQPLRRIRLYQLQDGMRVASVAEYYGQAQETTWKNFFPEVIPCVIHDEAENQRILDSISEEQWQALDAGLARIPAPNPGLYRLWGNALDSDVSAAVPWLQRTWVRVGLIAFACFGIGIIALQAWAKSSREKREQRAETVQSHPARSTTPAPLPAHKQSRDLTGRTLTFTNLMGDVVTDIALIKADYSSLTYKDQGVEKSMALALVPVEIQDSLEIPHAWHGYRAAQNHVVTAKHLATPSAGPTESTPTASAYQPGQKVYARWAGSWVSGTIIEPFGRNAMSYRVQLDGPRFRQPMVLSTNLLSPR